MFLPHLPQKNHNRTSFFFTFEHPPEKTFISFILGRLLSSQELI